MEQILDQPIIEPDKASIKYGGFWPRLGALIIDGLVLAPVSIGLTYLNVVSWKSSLILIVASLLSLAYKPLMEAAFGATLGKMAFNLRVVNLEYQSATLGQILLRNIFHIIPSVISLLVTISLYQLPEFESLSGYGDYTTFLSNYTFLQAVNIISGLVTLVDAIVLLSDDRKRSLHDKIGGTYVIEKVPGR